MAHVTVNHPVARAAVHGEQQKETPQRVETAEAERRFPVLSRFTQHLPTLMVMGLLAGLGAYGHHSDWKLPKFSALAGNGVGRAGGLVRRTWGAGVAVRRMPPGPAAPRQGLRLVQGARRSRTARSAIPRSRN